MTVTKIQDRISKLPAGLSLSQVARRLRLPISSSKHFCRKLGYKYLDGRKWGQVKRRKVDPDDIDFSMSPAAIGRIFKISRQRAWIILREHKHLP